MGNIIYNPEKNPELEKEKTFREAVKSAYKQNTQKPQSKLKKVVSILTSGEIGKAIRSIIPGAAVTLVAPEIGVPMMVGPAIDHAVSKTSPYSSVGDAVVQTAGLHPGEKGYVPASMAAEMFANPMYVAPFLKRIPNTTPKATSSTTKKLVGENKATKVTPEEVMEDKKIMKSPKKTWSNVEAEEGEFDARDWFNSDEYNARNPNGNLLSSEEMLDNINKTQKIENVNAIYNGKPSVKNVDSESFAIYNKDGDKATITYKKSAKNLRDAVRHETVHASDEGANIFPEYRGIKAESSYYSDPAEVRARVQSVAADMYSRGYNPNIESDVEEYISFMKTQHPSTWSQDLRDLIGDYRVVGETKSAYSFAPGQLMKLLTKGRAVVPIIMYGAADYANNNE